jgi:hypothetical protein
MRDNRVFQDSLLGTPAKCLFDCNFKFCVLHSQNCLLERGVRFATALSAPNDSSLFAVSSPDTAASRLIEAVFAFANGFMIEGRSGLFARKLGKGVSLALGIASLSERCSLPKLHFAGVPLESFL